MLGRKKWKFKLKLESGISSLLVSFCTIREYSQCGRKRVTEFMDELIDHQGKD